MLCLEAVSDLFRPLFAHIDPERGWQRKGVGFTVEDFGFGLVGTRLATKGHKESTK